MRTLLLILTIVLPLISAGQTSGTLQGKVTDKQTKDELAFVNIVLEQNGEQIGGASSDISGKYKIAGIVPGKYDVRASFIGYTEVLIRGIQINANQIRFFDIEMQQSAELLDECVVVDYIVPLIDKDRTVSGGTVTMHEIQKMPNRSVGSTATTVGGVYSRDGETGNIRGARSKGTRHYIDGMPVVGSSSLPQSAIIHPHYDYSNESYDKIIENIFKNPVYSPLSTFSIDVDVAAYSNMRRFINEGIIPPENAIRIEELINYFSYDYPQPEGKDPFSITSELADCPWNDNLLLHVGIQGKDIEKEDLPPSNLVFLLDVSGSMSSHDKLPLLKKALKLLVSQLRKEDRISIVVYAGSSGLALPSTRGSNKEKIMHVIDYLHAGGSTAGGKGIQLAYKVARKNFMKNGNNRIILATDGDFNVGVTSDNEMVEMIKEEREHGIFLSVLGFGTGNLKDSKMEKLADHGNGNYAYIDNLLEAKKVLVSEMGGTLFTIAKDVKIQIEFNPANVIEYRLIGYENRMLAAEDFNNDRKDAGEIGAGQTVTALYEIVTEKGETPIAPIDDLRYHTRPPADETLIDELATLKIRYKEPDASVSNLISNMITHQVTSTPSDNFIFSASVAEFGLIMRDSEYKGIASFENVLKNARSARGEDLAGYRAEFARLVELSMVLF